MQARHRLPSRGPSTFPLTFALLLTFALCPLPFALDQRAHLSAAPKFDVVEATIAQIHAAFKAKTLTCSALVDAYLKRIAAYDKKGPALNAIVVVNPNAKKEAEAKDKQFQQKGLT